MKNNIFSFCMRGSIAKPDEQTDRHSDGMNGEGGRRLLLIYRKHFLSIGRRAGSTFRDDNLEKYHVLLAAEIVAEALTTAVAPGLSRNRDRIAVVRGTTPGSTGEVAGVRFIGQLLRPWRLRRYR